MSKVIMILTMVCASIFVISSLCGSYTRFHKLHKRYLLKFYLVSLILVLLCLNFSSVESAVRILVISLVPAAAMFLRLLFNALPGGQNDRRLKQLVELVTKKNSQ
jgi:hypothetical protein